MTLGAIGRRYAKALLTLARHDSKVEQFGKELESFDQVLKSSESLQLLLNDPAFLAEQRLKVVQRIIEKLGLSVKIAKFIHLIVRKGRVGQFDDIFFSYQELSDELLGQLRVRVQTAFPLQSLVEEKLQKKLEELTHAKILLKIETNPDLLGGIIIQIQGTVFDGSVRNSLNKIEKQMMEVPLV